MTDTGPWPSQNSQDDPIDPRCDAVDEAIDAALKQTAPREVPEGLVERVAEASLQSLRAGRGETPAILRFRRPLARLAIAASVLLAVVAAFWLAGRQPSPEVRSLALVSPSVEIESGGAMEDAALTRFRGLQQVSDLNYADALTDLEEVVWAMHHGAGSRMVLSPGQTDMETIENELDSVRVVARIDG
ncbi:MAG: hypothetical protein QF781_02110 [Phycisphaerales bacterium]|jgi:hypothetical protein|nr:hypothetical protein [Phycisphaerales bacterium]MDP6310935.1 hypothetical protein [Phycisphaerales bacterium]MDP7188727.1 hypothetical protein [Phycisphaerales bacterium]MDP7519591.1 hypothetical protein [Phycisphaerales bacterium]HCA39401.1 hypothetical protein [Phycisphaerales bacterium]|tara:strand:- start:3335 stop:3898 length:564 start_codon:yes stop_codon:yes gene_type:complete